jgi:HSP20 family molecular chaperone IbpA
MTARLSLFDSPMFLGFDHFERTVDRLKKTSDGYPPYNIEQLDEHDLRITLAVAGFTMDDLDVEVENNQLTIRGKQNDDADERVFIHRGIEIKGASLDNGLLHIDMVRIIPEPQVQKIEIQGKSKSNKNGKDDSIIDIEGTNE